MVPNIDSTPLAQLQRGGLEGVDVGMTVGGSAEHTMHSNEHRSDVPMASENATHVDGAEGSSRAK